MRIETDLVSSEEFLYHRIAAIFVTYIDFSHQGFQVQKNIFHLSIMLLIFLRYRLGEDGAGPKYLVHVGLHDDLGKTILHIC